MTKAKTDRVERVARALCEKEGFGWESLLGEYHTKIRQEKYRALALVAIKTM